MQPTLQPIKKDFAKTQPELLPTGTSRDLVSLKPSGIFLRSASMTQLGQPKCSSIFLYTWLQSGDLWVAPWSRMRDGILKHPHVPPSFFRDAVLCAGFLVTRNGLLDYVDHTSGHYRPKIQHFLNFVDFLKTTLSPDFALHVEVSALLRASSEVRKTRLCAVPAYRAEEARCEAAWLLRAPLPSPRPLIMSKEENKRKCAFVFVFCATKGLLILRTSSGIYQLPGGHCEPGEDSRRAAARELFEETGIQLKGDSELRLKRLLFEDEVETLLQHADFYELVLDDENLPAHASSADGLFVTSDEVAGLALRLSPEHESFFFEPNLARADLLLLSHSHGIVSLALRRASFSLSSLHSLE